MKQLVYENIINKEKYISPAKTTVQTIDGIDYIRVFKFGTNHEVLIRKDSLRKVKQ